MNRIRYIFWVLAAFMVMQPQAMQACATCFGKTDSRLAVGMNWGIVTLLGVVGFVLALISAFFIYLIKRSATMSASMAPETTKKV